MPIPVLVIDAAQHFAAMLRGTLEETGHYQVTLASSAEEALEIAAGAELSLAIVDFELPDRSGPETIQALREQNPALKIIAIPMQDSEDALQDLELDGILSKPFYLPDLPEIVALALDRVAELAPSAQIRRPGPIQDAPPGRDDPPPPWLSDVDRAAQYLTRLSLESAATAALLTRGRRLWAYAGELSQVQVQALTGIIADYWASDGARGAVARYIRLPDAGEDFMLYATAVAGDIILSLVFISETPFGMIRRQAQSLARTLSEVDPGEQDLEAVALVSEPDDEPDPIPDDWIPEAPGEGSEFSFMAALGDIDLPPPDPDPDDARAQAALAETEVETLAIPNDWVPEKARPASHLPFLDLDDFELDDESAHEPAKRRQATPDREHLPLPESQVHLAFSAVLVPRFPEHRLSGELEAQLCSWVERICLDWDWRADRVRIEPDFLSVTISLSPDVAPARALHQLRDDLSARMLETYPDLAKNLSSGRFWARGYLLTAGAPLNADRIRTFVEETRQAQGLQVDDQA